MAHEQFVVDAALAGQRVLLHHGGGKAGRVGLAIGPDEDAVAGRRDLEAAEAALEAGELAGGAAGDGDRPDGILAALVRLEVDGRSDDLRCVFVDLRLGDQGFGLSALAGQVEAPQVIAAAIGGEIGFALRPDEPLAVRRRGRRADAAERGDVIDGELAGGGGRGDGSGGGEQARGKEGLHAREVKQIGRAGATAGR
ncbi:hypothetical protein SAQ01S_00840 [Sphingomonas aquatilis NBRC 16722]|nr:hypothetical protein SAQ01S_00840 [Sphingomonas aquatilis NBRC 16722]